MTSPETGSPDFLDLRTRAEFLALCGDLDAARQVEELSLQIAREIDLICYAYQLMWRERIDDAIEMLHYAVNVYADSWNAYHSLAEAYEQKGEFAKAIENYRKAHERLDDAEGRLVIERHLRSLGDLAAAC